MRAESHITDIYKHQHSALIACETKSIACWLLLQLLISSKPPKLQLAQTNGPHKKHSVEITEHSLIPVSQMSLAFCFVLYIIVVGKSLDLQNKQKSSPGHSDILTNVLFFFCNLGVLDTGTHWLVFNCNLFSSSFYRGKKKKPRKFNKCNICSRISG